MAAPATSRPTEPLVRALMRYMDASGRGYKCVAEACGLSPTTVFNVANGNNNPSYRVIKALHDGLGISYEEMFGEA